jgi:hypothetical protein
LQPPQYFMPISPMYETYRLCIQPDKYLRQF